MVTKSTIIKGYISDRHFRDNPVTVHDNRNKPRFSLFYHCPTGTIVTD